jgi:hypothetical protein
MIVHGGITPSKRWRSDPQIAHAVTLKMTSASFDNQYPRPNYSRWCHHPRRHARSRDTGSKHTGAVSFPLRRCRLNGSRLQLVNWPTTLPSSSSHQYGCGCALMNPRPNWHGINCPDCKYSTVAYWHTLFFRQYAVSCQLAGQPSRRCLFSGNGRSTTAWALSSMMPRAVPVAPFGFRITSNGLAVLPTHADRVL